MLAILLQQRAYRIFDDKVAAIVVTAGHQSYSMVSE